MKNSNLFLLVAALFALVSCGTVSHTAFYSTGQLRNSIYYSANHGPAHVVVQEQMEAPVALAEGESYESRLTKFDSPVYNVNIIVEDPYPWWGYRWHNPYYSPSWRWGYNWYSPWYSSWYDAYYWDWHWYHPYWYYPHYRPVHHPVYHPGPGAGRPSKAVYYGKRGSSPSYRDTGRGGVSVSHGSPMGKPTSGSVTRRPQNGKPVVNGENTVGRPQSIQSQQNQQNQQYRRTTERSNSSYSNSSSGSNRNSYVNHGGGQQRSGGSSGSYRRR